MAGGVCPRILIIFSTNMALSLEEIRNVIETRPKGATITNAIEHQNRIKFHAQTELTPSVLTAYSSFDAFVKNLLVHDKYELFKALFRYPVKTNEVTGICFKKLARIFDGRNPVFDYQFLSSDDRDDWEWYRKDILNEPKIWQTRGWEYFKNEINCVLVVDLAREQTTEKPEPYFYWLTIERVVSYDADYDGKMNYIIFRQKEGDTNEFVVIDDSSYRVFVDDDGELGMLISENPHDLGYCPARFFWDEPLSLNSFDIKKSPLTDILSDLDWFLFFSIAKKNLDLYGSYPIMSGYDQKCNYKDVHENVCDHGYLKDKKGVFLHDSAGNPMLCPVCGKRRMVGPGTFVRVPVPVANDVPDLRNPVQMLPIDRNSLDYNVEEENRLKNNIITSVVGTNEEVTAKQALNEQQIKANFESQNGILKEIKKSFENAMIFVDATICKLRYGNAFISAEINLGTEFYIYSANELRQLYKIAKESGASEAELDAMQSQIIATEYRNNPNQQQRMMVLADLEPYRHLTRQEILILYDKGLIDETELRIKMNFATFVRRFERENTNIVEFGTEIPYDKKIEIITNKFKEYASTDRNGGNLGRSREPGNEG